MIVIGYQGIGKSTLAGKEKQYIDLESGNFWVDGQRADNWHVVYCRIAEHLSKQGYTVFVSSHQVVRNELSDSTELVAVAYPSVELRAEWVDKLRDRYINSGLEKDYKALVNAIEHYNASVREMEEYAKINKKLKVEISDMKYDLSAEIDAIRGAV